MVRIHDLSTNEIIDREMTDEEFATYQRNQALDAARQAEAEAEAEAEVSAKAALAAAKQAAQDKLKALGLNDLEIAAITGA